jgi:hypothetical protein
MTDVRLGSEGIFIQHPASSIENPEVALVAICQLPW